MQTLNKYESMEIQFLHQRQYQCFPSPLHIQFLYYSIFYNKYFNLTTESQLGKLSYFNAYPKCHDITEGYLYVEIILREENKSSALRSQRYYK
jgi:hypothetical protein